MTKRYKSLDSFLLQHIYNSCPNLANKETLLSRGFDLIQLKLLALDKLGLLAAQYGHVRPFNGSIGSIAIKTAVTAGTLSISSSAARINSVRSAAQRHTS